MDFAPSTENTPDIESTHHTNKRIRLSESRTIELIRQEEENHGTPPISPVSIDTSIMPQPDSEISAEDLALSGPSGLNDNEFEEDSNQTARLSRITEGHLASAKTKKEVDEHRTHIVGTQPVHWVLKRCMRLLQTNDRQFFFNIMVSHISYFFRIKEKNHDFRVYFLIFTGDPNYIHQTQKSQIGIF